MQWKSEFVFQNGPFPAVNIFFSALTTDDGTGVVALRSEMARNMFRDGVRRAELPALVAYRAVQHSTDEMSAQIARARVELERIQAHDTLARADLTGPELALRLVELDDKRAPVEEEIRTLERGLDLYARNVNEARQRACAEVEPVAGGTAMAVASVAQQRCDELQKRIHDFVSPLLRELEALQHACDARNTPLLARELSGSVAGVVEGHGEWSAVDGRGEKVTQAASPDAADVENAPPPPPPTTAPIPDTPATTKRYRLEPQTAAS
jgi:hypothetical protein